MAVSLEYIYKKTRKFLLEEYSLQLEVPILINNRLESTYGNVKFFMDSDGKIRGIDCIEFHPGILQSNRYRVIDNLIKHEAIHYALLVQNKGYGEDDEDFVNELIRHKVGSCDLKLKKRFYIYKCTGCGSIKDVSRRKISRVKRCDECGKKVVDEKLYMSYDEVNKMIKNCSKL